MFTSLNVNTYRSITRAKYGGKAHNLARILPIITGHGAHLPKTYLAGTDIFDGFLLQNKITPQKINKIYDSNQRPSINAYNESDYFFKGNFYDAEELDSEILNIILGGSFSEKHMDELSRLFARIRNFTAKNPEAKLNPLAVRSSSVLEDQESNQFKGIYDSFFIPQSMDSDEDFSRFLEAIKLVYASAFLPKAHFYRAENGLPFDGMGIIAQFVVGYQQPKGFGPDFSGVMHYDGTDIIKTSVNKGLNTTVVDGKSLFNYSNPLSGGRSTASIVMIENILYQLMSPKYGSLIDIIERNKHNENPIRKDEISANANFSVNLSSLESVRRVVNGIVHVIKDITNSYGHGETEFSILGKRKPKVYFLQWRPRPLADTASQLDAINVPEIPQSRIISESSQIFGFGEIEAFLLIDPASIPYLYNSKTEQPDNSRSDFWTEALTFDPASNFIYITKYDGNNLGLSNIKALINLSDMPFSGAGHNTEHFEKNNIPVLTTLDINWDIIKGMLTRNKYISDVPVRLISDGKKGIVHLIENQSE